MCQWCILCKNSGFPIGCGCLTNERKDMTFREEKECLDLFVLHVMWYNSKWYPWQMDVQALSFDLRKRCEYFEWIIPNCEWQPTEFVPSMYHCFSLLLCLSLQRNVSIQNQRFIAEGRTLPASSFSLRNLSIFSISRILASCFSFSSRWASNSTSNRKNNDDWFVSESRQNSPNPFSEQSVETIHRLRLSSENWTDFSMEFEVSIFLSKRRDFVECKHAQFTYANNQSRLSLEDWDRPKIERWIDSSPSNWDDHAQVHWVSNKDFPIPHFLENKSFQREQNCFTIVLPPHKSIFNFFVSKFSM